jgi:Uncharacterized protein conserved in bacteria
MTEVSDVANSKFDTDGHSSKTSPYIIATQPRSGSHFLAALLRDTKQAGVPLEYFHKRHWQSWKDRVGADDREALEHLFRLRTSPNGQFGVKMHWHQFTVALKLDLESFFHDAKFVYMSRTDLLAQAVSHAIAQQTGVWHSGQKAVGKATFSMEAIDNSIQFLLQERSRWERFFAVTGVQPFRILYEDLLRDTDGEMRRLCTFLDVQWSGVDHILGGVQRTNLNSEWIEQFRLAKNGAADENVWKAINKIGVKPVVSDASAKDG